MGKVRQPSGSNLPAPMCGSGHPERSITCHRTVGHDGEHRYHGHIWSDEGWRGVRLDEGALDVGLVTIEDPTPTNPRVVFRSTEWDGSPPAPFDVLDTPWGPYVVVSVALGPGLGQYRIEAYEARTIVWDGTAPTPE